MRRMLYESRMVPRPADELERLLLDRAPELLAKAAGSELHADADAVDGSFTIDLPASWARLDMVKRVRVRIGVARRLGGRLLLPIAWTGEPGRHLFPTFEGTLELGAMFDDVTELTLAGSYGVPLGSVGAALDTTILHAAARDSAARLTQALAAVLTDGAPPLPPRGWLDTPRGAPLRVRHVMTRDPLVVSAETGVRAVARLLLSSGVSAVPVLDDDGGLLGVLSEHDLLAKEARRRFGFGRKLHQEAERREARTAGGACSKPARTTTPEAHLSGVAREMLDHDVNRLVVVDGGAVVGIVSRHDVLAGLVRDRDDVVAAVRRALAGIGADEAAVHIDDAGEVALSGTVPLRSVAAQAAAVARAVEGVMGVRADDLHYAEDDVLPAMPIF